MSLEAATSTRSLQAHREAFGEAQRLMLFRGGLNTYPFRDAPPSDDANVIESMAKLS
jgi:hypothetical protein